MQVSRWRCIHPSIHPFACSSIHPFAHSFILFIHSFICSSLAEVPSLLETRFTGSWAVAGQSGNRRAHGQLSVVWREGTLQPVGPTIWLCAVTVAGAQQCGQSAVGATTKERAGRAEWGVRGGTCQNEGSESGRACVSRQAALSAEWAWSSGWASDRLQGRTPRGAAAVRTAG